MRTKNRNSLSAVIGLGLSLWGFSAYAEDGYFSDDSASWRYGTAFKEPDVAGGGDIIKNILNFQHFNTDSLGSNYFYIDALFSHANDPAENSTHGATEIYGIFRRDWSMSKITGEDFSYGDIIRDVALHMGGDMNTKDTDFAPRKKLLVIGPELQFATPVGYFNVAFDESKEWNHNGIVDKDVDYNAAPEMEAFWGIPFHVYNTSWKFTGFFNYLAPKGRDGFGNETKTEIYTRPELMLDVGELIGKKSNVFEVGAGYEYWHNKYGDDSATTPGAFAKTPELIARIHI